MSIETQLLDKGQCVVCFEQTSDKVPCENCSNEFCCQSCIQTTISSSSESCRSGICFICRSKKLDVVIEVRNDTDTDTDDNRVNIKDAILAIIQICIISNIIYFLGAFARWFFYYDNTFLYYIGYNEDFPGTVICNFTYGIACIIILKLIYKSCTSSNRT